MKYEIKKARSQKGNIFWGIFNGKKLISAHGDRKGAGYALRRFRGEPWSKIQADIDKSNLRWMRNLTETLK